MRITYRAYGKSETPDAEWKPLGPIRYERALAGQDAAKWQRKNPALNTRVTIQTGRG